MVVSGGMREAEVYLHRSASTLVIAVAFMMVEVVVMYSYLETARWD